MVSDLEAKRTRLAKIGTLPISREWMYAGVRHYERNCDWEYPKDGTVPDRQCGGEIAELINEIPDMLDEIVILRGRLERLGSSEAMTGSFVIKNNDEGLELKARMSYARGETP